MNDKLPACADIYALLKPVEILDRGCAEHETAGEVVDVSGSRNHVTYSLDASRGISGNSGVDKLTGVCIDQHKAYLSLSLILDSRGKVDLKREVDRLTGLNLGRNISALSVES